MLQQHLAVDHGNSKELECKECGKTFKWPRNLLAHMAITHQVFYLFSSISVELKIKTELYFLSIDYKSILQNFDLISFLILAVKLDCLCHLKNVNTMQRPSLSRKMEKNMR